MIEDDEIFDDPPDLPLFFEIKMLAFQILISDKVKQLTCSHFDSSQLHVQRNPWGNSSHGDPSETHRYLPKRQMNYNPDNLGQF